MRASAYCAPAAFAASTARVARSLKSAAPAGACSRTRMSGVATSASAREPIAVSAAAADAVLTKWRRETDMVSEGESGDVESRLRPSCTLNGNPTAGRVHVLEQVGDDALDGHPFGLRGEVGEHAVSQ